MPAGLGALLEEDFTTAELLEAALELETFFSLELDAGFIALELDDCALSLDAGATALDAGATSALDSATTALLDSGTGVSVVLDSGVVAVALDSGVALSFG